MARRRNPTPAILGTLRRLAPVLRRGTWRLTGGTAVILTAHHRSSEDLDFVCEAGFSPDDLERRLASEFTVERVHTARNTLWVTLDGTKVSFISCGANLPARPLDDTGVPVASPTALAATKLVAITGRGARRDYIDLVALMRSGVSLRRALSAAARLFPSYPTTTVLQCVLDFSVADADVQPVDCTIRWPEARHELREATRSIVKKGH